MTDQIPVLAAALLIATLGLAAASSILSSIYARAALFASILAVTLLPLTPIPIAHYARVLAGNLSIVTILVLGVSAWFRIRGKTPSPKIIVQLIQLSIVVALAATLLYPTALGATSFDIYADGYYPVALGPLVLALFIVAVLAGAWLISAALALGFGGYSLHILESDNLWDYLMDPVLSVYAFACLVRHRKALGDMLPTPFRIQQSMIVVGAVYMVFAALLWQLNPDGLRYNLAADGGFLHGSTVLVLAAALLVCFVRLLASRESGRSGVFALTSLTLGFLVLVLAAGAASTTFDVPRYLPATSLGLYLLILTPLYRSHAKTRRWLDAGGVPMPANHHIAAWVVVIFVSESLIGTAMGQVASFGYSVVFFLNLAFPDNHEAYPGVERLVSPVTLKSMTSGPRSA